MTIYRENNICYSSSLLLSSVLTTSPSHHSRTRESCPRVMGMDKHSTPNIGQMKWKEVYQSQKFTAQASLAAQVVKNLPAVQETQVQSLGGEDLRADGMATHSSILAWRIPRTEEPGGLQSMGWKRVRQDWLTDTHYTPAQERGSLHTRQEHVWVTENTVKKLGCDMQAL